MTLAPSHCTVKGPIPEMSGFVVVFSSTPITYLVSFMLRFEPQLLYFSGDMEYFAGGYIFCHDEKCRDLKGLHDLVHYI